MHHSIIVSGIFFAFTISPLHCYTNYDIFDGFNSVQNGEMDAKPSEYNFQNNKSIFDASNKNLNEQYFIANSTDFLYDNSSDSMAEYLKSNLEILANADIKCSEKERPTNIGPYEVPTQRDIVLLYRNKIIELFTLYHKKIVNFLNDLKEVTKATIDQEQKCIIKEALVYRRCVKHVNGRYKEVTKIQVASIEKQRNKIKNFLKGHVCSMSAVKENPIKLMRALAIENVSLDFALTGFLKLLNECFKFCDSKLVEPYNG